MFFINIYSFMELNSMGTMGSMGHIGNMGAWVHRWDGSNFGMGGMGP